MLSMQLSNIVDTDAPITNINSYIANTTFKNHNEIYGSTEQALVNTNRYSGNNLRKDLETDLQNTEVLRMVSHMKKLDKANAIKYITSYAQGNDQLKLTTNDLENIEDAQNPIFKKYENFVGNEFNRKSIIKNAMDLYENYNSDKIKSMMASKQTYDLEGLQEPGQPLHISNFQDGANSNSTEYVINTLDGVGKTQFNKVVKITQDNIKAQKIASDMIGGTQKDFIDETQKELVTSALLSRYGINNENITDVSNPNLAVAMEVLSKSNNKVNPNCYSPDYSSFKMDFSKKKTQIIFLSNLLYSKGIFLFLKAISKLLKIHDDLVVKIAGLPMADEYMSVKEVRTKFAKESQKIKISVFSVLIE